MKKEVNEGKKKMGKGKQKEEGMEEVGLETNSDEQEEMVTEEGNAGEGEEQDMSGDDDDEEEESSDDEGGEEESGGDDDDDEGEEEDEDEGYVEPVSKTVTAGKSPGKKHVVFGDDETFENLPALSSVAAKKSPAEDEDESDSDAPPEEESFSTAKDIFAEDNVKMKEEILKLKKQVKEARRLKHEKNREQQMKKRSRMQKLEKSRLPADLLDAVAKEEKETKPAAILEKKGKRKTFDEDEDLSDIELFGEPIDDDGLIILDKGVQVRPVAQVLKKSKTIASIAADFRQNAMYNKKSPRMSSVAQRQMLVKQKKSGKNGLAS